MANTGKLKYFIHKSSRMAKSPYTGPACKNAGITPGKEYDTREEAQADADKLSEVNPAGFVVDPLDGEWH